MSIAVIGLVHGALGAYGISFPDFQGCISGGATVGDAVRRGRAALSFHIENMVAVGEAMPAIRDVADIQKDPTFSEDFADAVIAIVEVALP